MPADNAIKRDHARFWLGPVVIAEATLLACLLCGSALLVA